MNSMVITGATSSLGVALIEECIRNNVKVLALVRPGSANLDRIPKSDLVLVAECALSDLSDFAAGGGMEQSYDAFMHLAWESSADASKRNMIRPQLSNVAYSLDAVDLAERLHCSVFVGAGSQAEYGRCDEVLNEETPVHPDTPYGAAKLCACNMTRLACREKGIRHVWPRILSSYGPNYLAHTVINYTITELLSGRRPSLTGGEQLWDFIYGDDVARALYLLAEKGRDGEIYVIGSGRSRLLKDYLLTIRDLIDPTLELGLNEKPYPENAVMHLACDITKIKKEVGFEPAVSFEEGIRRTIAWDKEHLL
ncbi:MAG: NAD-dependent epimerase/dehydratase family protein [Lachnospiraceae bacterium]|nr:NAD-dependent epimerase/dehydratase family protein [Lachnospiraceae bacterium]